MLGRLDAGRQPTEMPMFFGGTYSTGFRYNVAVHLLLGSIAELGEILNICRLWNFGSQLLLIFYSWVNSGSESRFLTFPSRLLRTQAPFQQTFMPIPHEAEFRAHLQRYAASHKLNNNRR
jgi:hypothetical protein